jgi:hypothetical protein
MLFPALDRRKHLASAVRLVTIQAESGSVSSFRRLTCRKGKGAFPTPRREQAGPPNAPSSRAFVGHLHGSASLWTLQGVCIFAPWTLGPSFITGRSGVSRPSWCTPWCKAHLPEGLTSEIVWLVDLDSNQDSRSHSPDRRGEFASHFCKLSSQAAHFCQRVAANLQSENPCVTRLNTGLLVENGARKQTLRFAVYEPWSVCDPSVSFLSATICL